MSDRALLEALAASQRLGMLGARPVDEVVEHASAFVDALEGVTGTVVDLGSGGGVPGLVIAWRRTDLRVLLVDRRTTRTDHLARLVGRLGVGDRVEVMSADASTLPTLLDPVDAVVARGFGHPEATLRAAAPILGAAGRLVVSEPPDAAPDRWATAPQVGLQRIEHRDRRVAVFLRFHVEHVGSSRKCEREHEAR